VEALQASKEKRWDIFQWYFRIQLGLQILTDVAAVFAGMKKLACLNDNSSSQKCKMTDTLLNIILGI
jgi:hypothetical protein